MARVTRRYLTVGLLVTACIGLFGCGRAPAVAPTSYSHQESPDHHFQCQYPSGWNVTSTGGKGLLSHLVFRQGSAEIDIVSDVLGSLLGGVPGPRDANEESPVVRVHDLGKEKLTAKIGGAEEQSPQPVETAIGEGRISEFSAPGVFGKTRGYRATVLGRDRRITVICSCPESDWETLKPAFYKVITSLAPGSGR